MAEVLRGPAREAEPRPARLVRQSRRIPKREMTWSAVVEMHTDRKTEFLEYRVALVKQQRLATDQSAPSPAYLDRTKVGAWIGTQGCLTSHMYADSMLFGGTNDWSGVPWSSDMSEYDDDLSLHAAPRTIIDSKSALR